MPQETDFILNKARHFCSYQERYTREVEEKLRDWKVNPAMSGKVLEQLIEEDYLNESRYARSFASGKFRIKHWGKNKIMYELKRRGVPENIIQAGLEEIDDQEYHAALQELLTRKNGEIRDKDLLTRKKKLLSFALQKGYEYSMIKQMLAQLKL